ncbi:hypothetical protein Ais01nite_74010 [Asanoa ishikariensis]|nr:hypothetical protein Ais01nite_74010 [Asanoa ishikariensis]
MSLAAVAGATPAYAAKPQLLAAYPLPVIISNITAWIIGLLVGVATLFLTIGGLRRMAAGGDPTEIEKANSNLKNALIGYALAILAPILLAIVHGTLGIVVIQAFALHTTLAVFLSPQSNLRVLGLPIPNGEPNTVLNLLIVICLLWGVVKIPGMMRRYVTQSRPSAMGTILRVVLVQQLTRGISRAFGSGRGAARAAGRAGGGAGGASRPWPVRSGGMGRSLSVARTASAVRPTQADNPIRRAVRPYTREEIVGGVDLYTPVAKRQAPPVTRSSRPPIRAAGVEPRPPRSGPPVSVSPDITPATAIPRTRPVRKPVTGPWNRRPNKD